MVFGGGQGRWRPGNIRVLRAGDPRRQRVPRLPPLQRRGTSLYLFVMPDATCRICSAPIGETFAAREMMLGLRDRFDYGECAGCGALQLCTVPADWERYYPTGYYSLQAPPSRGWLRTVMRRIRNTVLYRHPVGAGAMLGKVVGKVPWEVHKWFAVTGTRRRSRILDVGSGVGLLVRDLGEVGFSSVRGIDPFVRETIRYASGARVDRATIQETSGEYDLIMFHHSLEHIPDQVATLRRAAELLSREGWCLVRIPVASSYAWRHYREHWVQLDAPRHHVLHTNRSLELAAREAGLRVERVVHDSTALQFYGSEAYRRDVPLAAAATLYSPAEMRVFERRAAELNARGDGDQACFYLRRA